MSIYWNKSNCHQRNRTPFATILAANGLTASNKTGNFTLNWFGVIITEAPVITRVWVGTTLTNTVVGPPSPIRVNNGNSYVDYCFYRYNLPNQGTLTLEFSNPRTGAPLFLCCFNISTNAACGTPPPVSCAPTITTQPANRFLCGQTSTFVFVTATGATSYAWEYQAPGTSTWTSTSSIANFVGTTNDTLNINNVNTYNGYKFRCIATNSGAGCGSVTTSIVTVNAYPRPTASFAAGAFVCGPRSMNLRIDLTGTPPWNFTYTTTPPGTVTTISNISSSPYFLAVSPTVTTTYEITGLNDQFCTNTLSSGSVQIVVQALPTISLTSSSISTCFGSGTASLAYTATTSSPNQYSITSGTRAVAGFTAVTNASLTGSPISITLPANTPVGTYDFNLTVRNSTSGCVSANVPFSITVNPKPDINVSSSVTSVCSGGSATLQAAPTTFSSYSWYSNPAGASGLGTSLVVSPTVNTTYSVIGTNANGCRDTASVTVTVRSPGTLTTSGATICAGTSAGLTVSGAATYSWSPATGLSTTVGSSVIATPSVTTTYTINATFSNGCTGSTTATVTVNSAPAVSISSSRRICQGSSVTLTASGASTYAWSPTSTLSAGTGSSVTATPTTTTIYTVVGTDANGCVGRDTQQIIVVSSPVISSPGDNFYYCGNSDLTMTVTTSSSSNFVWWSGNSAGSFTNYKNGVTGGANGYVGAPSDSNTSATTATMLVKTPPNNDQFFQLIVKNGGCRFPVTITLREFASSSTVIPSIGSNQTYCGTTTANTLSLQGTTNASYSPQWSFSTNSSTGPWTNVGTASTSYSPGSVSTTSWYRLILTPGGSCGGPYTSNIVQITINSAIASNTLSASNCVTAATTITGATPTGGSGTYTYRWESSPNNSTWTEIAGATGQNYTAPMTTSTTWYRRIVTSGACQSTSAAVSISPAIQGNEIAANQNLCQGASASNLTVGTLAGGSGSYTYQWESSPDNSSWSNISAPAGTGSSFAPGALASTTWYRLSVTSGSCNSTSNVVRVRVNPLPTLSLNSSATTVCAGTTATLTATANQGSTFSWSANLGTASLSATTGSVVTITPTATTDYTVTATDTNGCQMMASQVITYRTLPAVATLSSATASVCNPPTSTYDLDGLISSTPPGSVSYNWYTVSSNPTSTYLISGGNVSSSGAYYVFAEETSFGTTCYSSAVTATVNFVNVAAPAPLASSIVLCDPLRANLTTYQPEAAAGTTLEWHSVASSPIAGSPPGGTQITPATSVGTVGATNTYYLYAKSTSLGCYSSASSAVTVTINAQPNPAVNSATASVCSPGTVDLMAGITSPSATSTYQWFTSNTDPTPANMIENPYVVSTAGTYYLYETNSNNCRSQTPASVTLTVNSTPTLSVSGTGPICEGTSATFTATASGSPTYQWYRLDPANNSVITLTNTSPYSGVTSPTLNINPTTGLGNYLYYVIATSAGCSTTSDYAALQLNESTVTTTVYPTNKVVTTLPAGATFIYEANTANVDYYWQVYNGSIWRNIGTTGNDPVLYANYTTNRLEVLTVNDSMNNFRYRCQAGNGCDTAMGFAMLNTPISLNLDLFQLNVQSAESWVKLTWLAAGEDEVSHYIPQYSFDGKQFFDYGAVSKKAVSGMNSYTLTLARERGKTVYYRIVAVGLNGIGEYSNRVVVGADPNAQLVLSPNPLWVSASKAECTLHFSRDCELLLKIYGADGKLLMAKNTMLNNGKTTIDLKPYVHNQNLLFIHTEMPESGEIKTFKLLVLE